MPRKDITAVMVQSPIDMDDPASRSVSLHVAKHVADAIVVARKSLSAETGATSIEFGHVLRGVWVVLESLVNINPVLTQSLWMELSVAAAAASVRCRDESSLKVTH